MELFLTAKDTAQERIKAYLEQNASEDLIGKINMGVLIEKDGKHLMSKKTLDGFMKYATKEARKTVANGTRCACIDDQTVFGWAIHYFGEDSITELLYNEDGSEYKTAPKPKAEPKQKAPTKTAKILSAPPKAEAPKQEPTPTPKAPQKQKNKPIFPEQVSIFDLL